MSVSTKVVEGIYYLNLPLWGTYTGSTIIASSKLALIDTGMPDHPEKYIFPFLRSIDRDPKEISLIINTHTHGDHVGGNLEIKKVSGAEIAAHELAVGKIPGAVDKPLKDGEILEVGEFKFEVVHAPGHSPDSTCFLELDHKILISGDAIQGNGDIEQGLALITDIDAYRNSIKKLIGLNFQCLVLGHAYNAKNEILFGKDARDFVVESLEYSERYEEEIIRMLRATEKPLSRTEMHRRLLKTLALPSANELVEFYLRFLSVFSRPTIDAYVERLPAELKSKVKDSKWEDVGTLSAPWIEIE